MKKEDFLIELQELLQRDDVCHETDILNNYDEWDSLAILSIMTFFNNNFGMSLTINEIEKLTTVNDLIRLAGDKINV